MHWYNNKVHLERRLKYRCISLLLKHLFTCCILLALTHLPPHFGMHFTVLENILFIKSPTLYTVADPGWGVWGKCLEGEGLEVLKDPSK